MRMLQLMLVAIGGVLVVAGCSGTGGGQATVTPSSTGTNTATSPTDGDTVPTTGEPAPPIPADLTITVVDGTSRPFKLTCAPDGGDHPQAAEACAQLNLVGPSVFAEPPADQICTEIYGGPQTATVTGTFGGSPVNARFARTNGCEIDRWDSVAALLSPGT